ncbi:MAG: hypothetical protein QOF48_193 [Verrucomicrobiota bacterium]|jgi:hypothetical protein
MTGSLSFYDLLADLVLVVHFAFVLFVLLGLIAIWVGGLLRWSWVRHFWFRLAHVLAIGIVVAESVGGMVCPLTTWEDKLRRLAGGGEFYGGSFVQYWVHRLMFFEASRSTFTIIYVTFFTTVLASFWFVKPRPPRRRRLITEDAAATPSQAGR